jgi:predicted RecB family nuclease
MKLTPSGLRASPTDLAYFLACRHRTALELAEAQGGPQRPQWDDPLLQVLFKLGLEHERQYAARLEAEVDTVVRLDGEREPAPAVTATTAAMRHGADVILQGALASGRWYGRPDVLIRVPQPSPLLGDWSYQVADTKLARDVRGGTILQLGLYCEMLEAAQGVLPEKFYVVTPPAEAPANGGHGAHVVHPYRVHDFAAYFRLLKARLEAALREDAATLAAANYPEPVDHCDICPWSPVCRDKRRRDDHLSLVAGISRMQRRELAPFGILTVEALGALGDPFPFKPNRGALETYTRVRDQARLQVQSRSDGRIAYELIHPPKPVESDAKRAEAEPAEIVGLARLPEPSPGDVFLDLEGDPLAACGNGQGETGREYLFGVATVGTDGTPVYQSWWADDGPAERRAFESVVDLIMDRLAANPGLHVYHYAPYEVSAFKRLMGRYATREAEIDRLLRGGRFVDLYAVVRQGVRVGVEKYSIKNLEPLYGFTRCVDLREANGALRVMEQALELGEMTLATPEVRAVVEGYNRDDCLSTLRLRDWLEARRAELVAGGVALDRPVPKDGAPSEELDERQQKVEALRARLLANLPEDPRERSAGEHARSILAYLLDLHRREEKAGWWEYYRLREMPEEDLLEEPDAVAGLEFVADVGKVRKSVVQRYSYPEQEMEIRLGQTLKTQDDEGVFTKEIAAIDPDARTIDLVVGPSKVDRKPRALFAHDHISTRVLEDAVFALGERVAAAGGVEVLPPGAERALLLRDVPSLASGCFAPPAPDVGPSVTDYAVDIVTRLDRTTLAIQGPPGSGKTFTGARMIVEALRAGLKVGVTATSHKVIDNLLEAVPCAPGASDSGVAIRLGHKVGDGEDGDEAEEGAIARLTTNDEALGAIRDGEVNVLGGTAWLWARPEFAASVDVLFVDEAGQMSLANTLAVARAASSLVLLGDPQQLEQPGKGSHPEGVGVSALHHVLGGAETMPEGRGLFLPVTWRLAPSICAFTSELFYTGHLRSRDGLERQALAGNGRFEGAGLWLVPVEHDGNRNASDEEAAEVVRIVRALLAPGSEWIDDKGKPHRIKADDLRIVAPFNAHVHRIREVLAAASDGAPGLQPRGTLVGTASDGAPGLQPRGIPVGTVDKFQGQEAPVVIYSMATSRPEDAPRGLEFLYSLNRLNVATSRARCACILVASPRLFEPDCRTPRQMKLANALCRYRETAVRVPGVGAPATISTGQVQ